MTAAVPTVVIQIDSREQVPLVIEAYPTETVTLSVGDYTVKGFGDWTNPAFIIERKSLSDLIGSLSQGRDRFHREIEKLRQFGFRALLIEADRADVENHQYPSAMTPQSALATLDALTVRTGLHVVWCRDRFGAARQVESFVRQFVRGIEKNWRLLNYSEIPNSCPPLVLPDALAVANTKQASRHVDFAQQKEK